MKLSSLIISLTLLATLSTGAGAQTSPPQLPTPPQPTAPPEHNDEQKALGHDAEEHAVERTAAAETDVAVTLCLASGSVVVRGWDRREVRARSTEAEKIELTGGAAGQAAKRVEVLVSNDEQAELSSGDCGGTGSIELDVPRGATVNLQLREGDVEISDVAEARVESLNGDVDAQRVSKGVEISCMSGDISLLDSSGRARLRSISGSVEATNVRTVEAGDDFSAVSTSGDVTLERIAHSQVKGATISGRVSMSGPLARGGSYEFKTTSGDVILELPANSSFNINARVVASGEIVTDFPVKMNAAPAATPPNVKEAHQTRLSGTVGAGDADITLTTFSGTVHLKKQ
ncbi:MAG TPA: DUF4097 family beta strand repeat-containing protein [Pyrinomonadaceae bacterium]|jgi:hypothetical protein|nr:DUF4097 family beta strand repeat-containing protein [Pyrinomonadaceae bacterium]